MENKESWTHLCLQMIHKKMKTDRFGSLFATPVLEASDSVIPRHVKDAYRAAISNPMDYRTVKEKLDSNAYTCPQEFHDDMLLIYNNCIKFNPPFGVNKWIHDAAIVCRSKYQKLWEKHQHDIEVRYRRGGSDSGVVSGSDVGGNSKSGGSVAADDDVCIQIDDSRESGGAHRDSGGAQDGGVQGGSGGGLDSFTGSGEAPSGQGKASGEVVTTDNIKIDTSGDATGLEGSGGALASTGASHSQMASSESFQTAADDSSPSTRQINEPLPVFRLSMASIAEYKRRMGLLADVSKVQKSDETSGIIEALPEQRMGLLSLQPSLEGGASAGVQDSRGVQSLPFTSSRVQGGALTSSGALIDSEQHASAQIGEATTKSVPPIIDTQMTDSIVESQQSPSSASTSLSPVTQKPCGDVPFIDGAQAASQQPPSKDATPSSAHPTTLEQPEQVQQPLQTFQTQPEPSKVATEHFQQLPPIMAREYNGLYQVNWLTENECNQYFPNACIIGLHTKPAASTLEPPTSSNNIRYIYHQMFQNQKSTLDDKGQGLRDAKALGTSGGLKQQQPNFADEEKQSESFVSCTIGDGRLQGGGATAGGSASGGGATTASTAPSVDYTMQEHDRITFNLAESPATRIVKPQFSWPSTSYADSEDEEVDEGMVEDKLSGNVAAGPGQKGGATSLEKEDNNYNGGNVWEILEQGQQQQQRLLQLNMEMESTASLDEATRRRLVSNGFKRVISLGVPVFLYSDPSILFYPSLRGYYKVDECCFTHEHQLVRHVRLAFSNCGKCQVKIAKKAQTLAKMLLSGGAATLLLGDKCARAQVPFFNLKNASRIYYNNKLHLLWRSQRINDAIPRPITMLHLLV